MNLLEQAYDHIVSELARLDRERERLENTSCACGHEWHQHKQERIIGHTKFPALCWYRGCPCERFTDANGPESPKESGTERT